MSTELKTLVPLVAAHVAKLAALSSSVHVLRTMAFVTVEHDGCTYSVRIPLDGNPVQIFSRRDARNDLIRFDQVVTYEQEVAIRANAAQVLRLRKANRG